MNYQVLARKWRPRRLGDIKGQEPVVRALTNALNTQRLHHAYLFTGTRGVGKTSLARILAQCLSCERGVSAQPCGECSICVSLEHGNFPDLLEIDAASRTRVEDTRDILHNVQFSPAMGRYKIYLIDEVHMLSTHSFNALLKTLEEPPAHVIFLLATTDPQKLPATILSRCLQFNLRNVSPEKLSAHLAQILTQEQMTFEQDALNLVSKAADGSIRDALSLLEQVIAYGHQSVTVADVQAMLGIVPTQHVMALLSCLIQADSVQLNELIEQAALQGFDFATILEELLTLLADIALIQAVPSLGPTHRAGTLAHFAQQSTQEDIQLYYQIALLGRRDLPLAPSPRIGFTMALLRMLAFRLAPPSTSGPIEPPPATSAIPTPTSPPVPVQVRASSGEWTALVDKMSLSGVLKTLVDYTVLKEWQDKRIHLLLDPNQAAVLNPRIKQRLADELMRVLGSALELVITVSAEKIPCPARLASEQQQQQIQAAAQTLQSDQQLSSLMARFDGKVVADSIKPLTAISGDIS